MSKIKRIVASVMIIVISVLGVSEYNNIETSVIDTYDLIKESQCSQFIVNDDSKLCE